jgi:hypothetical protein
MYFVFIYENTRKKLAEIVVRKGRKMREKDRGSEYN